MIPLKEVPGIRTQVVAEPKNLSIWVPAEVIADETSQFMLSSPVSGILGPLLVPPGRSVSAGTVLAEVRSPELARMHADWLTASARLKKADADLAREERLDAKNATSQKELEKAREGAAIARAEEESARRTLESIDLAPEQGRGGAAWRLRAPKSGAVVEYKAISGQGVSAGQELGFFVAAGQSIARMELVAENVASLKLGQFFAVRQSGGGAWQGKLEGIAPALSSDTMRRSHRLRIIGNAQPLPGASVEVEVPFPPSIVLPQAALQQVEGRWGVYKTHHGHAEFCPVARGQGIGGEVMILGGIKPGESVVVEGAYLLKAYQQKLANPDDEGGHVH